MSNGYKVNDSCLVLMAHGSKHANWLLPFQQLAGDVTKDVGKDRVRLCFMELARPSLEEVVEQLHGEGKKHVRLLPLFLAQGSHLCHDVPEQLDKLRILFPGLTIEQLPPIGENEQFAELLRTLIKQIACPTS